MGWLRPRRTGRDCMSRKAILSNISVYSFAHALVDATCAGTLFAILALGAGGSTNLVPLVILYDGIAFSTQPIFGLLVDRFQAPRQAALAGLLLVALAALWMDWPLLAAVTAGLGNAIFHVGGGVVSLNLVPGKAALPGIYVAPGALGLMIGMLVGKGGGFLAWPFLLLLSLAALLILIVPRVEIAAPRRLPADLKWFETVILLLLVSVAIRSMVGMSLVLPWKSDPVLLVLLTSAVVLGKAFGGILGDRFGWTAVAVSGLALSAPLLAFFAPIPAAAIAGTFLFNLSMPVTLIGIAGMLPGKGGFAFGLTTLALILGAFPTFTPLRAWTGQPALVFAAVLVSVVALYVGLRLFDRHFLERRPEIRSEGK